MWTNKHQYFLKNCARQMELKCRIIRGNYSGLFLTGIWISNVSVCAGVHVTLPKGYYPSRKRVEFVHSEVQILRGFPCRIKYIVPLPFPWSDDATPSKHCKQVGVLFCFLTKAHSVKQLMMIGRLLFNLLFSPSQSMKSALGIIGDIWDWESWNYKNPIIW